MLQQHRNPQSRSGQKHITLKGSAQLVTEFFDYALSSILFQRGLYPPDDFKSVKKYGLQLLVSCDDRVQEYLKRLLAQVEQWLRDRAISRLVLVISSKDTNAVLERWQFDIQLEDAFARQSADGQENAAGGVPGQQEKSEQEIQAEIGAILRQITASVSFLPLLDEPCSFNVLAYTDKTAQVPLEWVDSDARMILRNAEHVRTRGFSTTVHKVDALVSYRVSDD